jgi:hypothetical protein
MKRLAVFFFLMISMVHYSFSQGEFIKRGKSGFGGSVGISIINKEIDGSLFYAGFSYKGFLDLGLTYWKANDGKINGEIFTPSFTYYPVKQEDAKKMPTLGISLGYSHYKSKPTSFVDVPEPTLEHRIDTIKKDLIVDAVKFGVSACRRIGYWKGSYFQPMIGAGISIIGTSLEFILRGSCAIGTRIKGWPLLVLTPSIERQSDVTTFVLTFSIVS